MAWSSRSWVCSRSWGSRGSSWSGSSSMIIIIFARASNILVVKVNIDFICDLIALSQYISQFGSCNKMRILLVICLNLTVVSIVVKLAAFSSCKLCLECINVLLFNGVNRGKYVPEDVSVAWWCCNWSFVDPSVVHVHHHHKITIGLQVYCWVVGFFPRKSLKERIDHQLLRICELNIVVIHREHKAHGSVGYISFSLFCSVDCVHFQLHSFSVNSMLRTWMKMELDSIILLVCAKQGFSNSGHEHAISSIKGNLGCMFPLPHYLDVLLVVVTFLKSICRMINIWISIRRSLQIDWWLVWQSAVWEGSRPVCTICRIHEGSAGIRERSSSLCWLNQQRSRS